MHLYDVCALHLSWAFYMLFMCVWKVRINSLLWFCSLLQDSSVIDFYPTDFKVDLNGKRFAWQGVALLPFVEESRLIGALESVYPNLTSSESEPAWPSVCACAWKSYSC